MGNQWPKIIRDPIHNIVAFEDNPTDRLLFRLIDTPEFQRLRRIKQLGLSELTFPGATHSRFTHSVGVLAVARTMLQKLERDDRIDEESRTAVLCAALLHDIGHGPFSHAFESVTGINHERRSLDIIAGGETEVFRVLSEYDPELPERVASFLQKDPEDAGYLAYLISSQLDADRFDYLLRDSHATGTKYGQFDLSWIIEHLCVTSDKKILYLDRKCLSVAEEYVFARYHMYQSVYFHKATRAAEVMLRKLLQRYKTLLSDGSQLAPPIHPRLKDVFACPDKMSLDEYLQLDDTMLWVLFRECSESPDNTLKYMGRGLLQRKLLKGIDITEENKSLEIADAIREIMKVKEFDPENYFCKDTIADTPYKPYESANEHPTLQIYLEGGPAGRLQSLEQIATPVTMLTKRISRYRYYYPQEIRDEVETVLETI